MAAKRFLKYSELACLLNNEKAMAVGIRKSEKYHNKQTNINTTFKGVTT